MASIGSSLPFILETKTESSVLLHINSYHRLRLSFFMYRPRMSADSTGFTGSASGYSVLGLCSGLIGGCSRRRLWRKKPSRLMALGSEEGSDESEDTLQATIEKSKKVLAMQTKLLQQVLPVTVIMFVC